MARGHSQGPVWRPRGTQVTPIAFLLDEAHGWAQERFTPGAFGLDPQWNPALLTAGRHEAGIRGWFDIAYYPAPETQNEPSSAIRQTYVNGISGDIFDVIVTVPSHTAIASVYPVLIAAGVISLSQEWSKALLEYVQSGGSLVVSADQLTGPGVKAFGLSSLSALREGSSFTWTLTGQSIAYNAFRFHALAVSGRDRVLASVPDSAPLCLAHPVGKGQIIVVGVPMGLGIDERPTPLLGLLLRHLAQGLLPVQVSGDVEWVVNRLDNGGWVVALFNNRGVIKPQHGVLPTDHRQAQQVTLRLPFGVTKSTEWVTGMPMHWMPVKKGGTLSLTVPAGGVRLVEFIQERQIIGDKRQEGSRTLPAR